LVWVPIVFELFFLASFLELLELHTHHIHYSFIQTKNEQHWNCFSFAHIKKQRSERSRVCARERVAQGTWYCTIVVYIPRTHTEGTCHVSRGTGVPHRVDVCSKFKIDNGTWNSRTRCTGSTHTRLLQDCRQYFYFTKVTLALNLHSQRQTNSGLASDYIKYQQIPGWYKLPW
jgi:hypothetical protein